jgi:hypothetical protein
MKKIIYPLLFLLFSAGLTSCEGLFDDCRVCRLNTYENGNLINSAQEAEYCGAELIAIQAKAPETIGATTYVWECD